MSTGVRCRATRREKTRAKKGVAKARLDANRWNRAKKMRRAWFSSGAERGGGSDARLRPRSRDDFWFWGGSFEGGMKNDPSSP